MIMKLLGMMTDDNADVCCSKYEQVIAFTLHSRIHVLLLVLTRC